MARWESGRRDKKDGCGVGESADTMQATMQADGGQCNMNIDVQPTMCRAVGAGVLYG